MARRKAGFDPAAEDWVMVTAAGYVFEPLGADFLVKDPGSVVVTYGGSRTRHRGVEVSYYEDGAVIWMPAGARAYWLPDDQHADPNTPWETRVVEIDYENGTLKQS